MKDLRYHFGNSNDKNVVFGFPYFVHFGDQIAFVNLIKNLNPVGYKINPLRDNGKELCSYFFDDESIFTNEQVTHHFYANPDALTEAYNCKYFNIDHKLKPKTKTYISYSFNGQSDTDIKIPPYLDELVVSIIKKFPSYPLIKVGEHLGLKKTIDYLTDSVVSVTVDNGIAHLTRCISMPHIIIEHKMKVDRTFPIDKYSSYIKGTSVESIIDYISKII